MLRAMPCSSSLRYHNLCIQAVLLYVHVHVHVGNYKLRLHVDHTYMYVDHNCSSRVTSVGVCEVQYESFSL